MKLLFTAMMLSAATLVTGQTINFAAEVTLSYEGETLDRVFEDLTQRYGIKFSYSRQIIPVERQVYLEMEDVALVDALDALFDNTQVVYGFIGDQFVLSVDPGKSIGQIEQDLFDDSIADAGNDLVFIERESVPSPIKLRASRSAFEMDVSPRNWSSQNVSYISTERQRRLDQAHREQDAVHLQATLLPPLQAMSHPNSDLPVNLSFNLFWGTNQNLSGFELGGFGNYIRGDVTGVQLAGAFNGAGQSLEGVQIGGFGNYARTRSTGLQIGGVGNVARDGGEVVQVGGAANIAQRQVMAQFAGAVNVADEATVQIAPINVARKVTGVQFGVINVADTVTGTAIGLFTFVRNGYRSFELAGQESVYANANFRLGVRPFYNIFHVGVNDERARTWSLGYGIGTSIRSGRNNYIQLELMARHINENESWTDELNLLNSFNVTWDVKIAGAMRLALGPTFNVAVSQRYNPETETYGMDIPRYTIHESTYHNGGDPVNLKYWVGFHAGLRISTN